MIWKCPNCNAVLSLINKRLACEAGHSFDYAKQGYVNLLLDNQRNSKNPGDNNEMIDARRRFLRAEYYNQVVKSLMPYIKGHSKILDLGCGEGFYLTQIAKLLTFEKKAELIWGYGIDISKNAVKKAASSSHTTASMPLEFAVASTYQIPIMDNSINTAISIFSPFCPEEVGRVLVNNGQLIRVSPGLNHLIEIKNALYSTAKNHSLPEVPSGFKRQSCQTLSWSQSLTGEVLVEDLIPMTPLHWHGSIAAKNALKNSDMKVMFDFYIEVFELI